MASPIPNATDTPTDDAVNAPVDPVLSVRDLVIEIGGQPIVDGVSFEVPRGACLAVVGESGCGKTLTSLAAIGLLPDVARATAGSIRVDGREVVGADEPTLRALRGKRVSMIFQEPVQSLNPLMRVGDQIAEGLRVHEGLGARAARERVVDVLAEVGIPNPAERARQYPFELSGGMCQRIMIAAALVRRPALLIADEPTTALDVTIQAQILALIRTLRRETGTSVMLVTHDMGVVAESADRISVMYAGRVVESAAVDALFARPRHPYTALLLRTIPSLDGARKAALPAIAGSVPDAGDWPAGCRFASRCPLAGERCRERAPVLEPAPNGEPTHLAACWYADRVGTLA